MIAFDAGGNIRWSVAGSWQPLIATADGGVIAANVDTGAIVTFDQYGNSTGQLQYPNVPGYYSNGLFPIFTYSWTGNVYKKGSIDQVYPSIIFAVADSFWAFWQGNASGNGAANRPITKTVQQLVAQIALGYANQHSQNRLDSVNLNQCNIFVKAVLKQAGLTPPVSPANPSWGWRLKYLVGLVDTPGYPAQSRDWANPSTDLKCWHAVTVQPSVGSVGVLPPDVSKPGDVIAEAINYSNAFGHVGIVVGPGQTASADSAAQCVIGLPAGTIDVSDYGFRPDNWVDPLPCGRIYGKKKDAVVKRFVCQ